MAWLSNNDVAMSLWRHHHHFQSKCNTVQFVSGWKSMRIVNKTLLGNLQPATSLCLVWYVAPPCSWNHFLSRGENRHGWAQWAGPGISTVNNGPNGADIWMGWASSQFLINKQRTLKRTNKFLALNIFDSSVDIQNNMSNWLQMGSMLTWYLSYLVFTVVRSSSYVSSSFCCWRAATSEWRHIVIVVDWLRMQLC